MALTDFFRINFPYGIAKNKDGAWMAFNREYLPLGFNQTFGFDINSNSDYPIHTKYKNIKDNTLVKLADLDNDSGTIQKDDNGNIITVFLYNDRTNPMNQSDKNNNEYWQAYFDKLKILAQFVR